MVAATHKNKSGAPEGGSTTQHTQNRETAGTCPCSPPPHPPLKDQQHNSSFTIGRFKTTQRRLQDARAVLFTLQTGTATEQTEGDILNTHTLVCLYACMCLCIRTNPKRHHPLPQPEKKKLAACHASVRLSCLFPRRRAGREGGTKHHASSTLLI